MRAPDAGTIAANWASAMGSAQTATRYKAGVQAVTVSPTQLAATPEAMDRYVQGVQQSVSSGKRAAALNAVTLAMWQGPTLNKGAARLASGAQASQQKMASVMQKWAPIYGQMSAAVQNMPKGGLGNAMARVQAAISIAMQAAGSA